jgi:hypothetical protein
LVGRERRAKRQMARWYSAVWWEKELHRYELAYHKIVSNDTGDETFLASVLSLEAAMY